MKNYFEYKDENSAKFWEISLHDKTITTRYGKIDTTGQTSEKVFPDHVKAKKEYEKLIKEKTAKGYCEIKTDSPSKNEAVPANAAFEFIKHNASNAQILPVSEENIKALQQLLGFHVPKVLADFWLEYGFCQYFNRKKPEDYTSNEMLSVHLYANIDHVDGNMYRLHSFYDGLYEDIESMFGPNFHAEREYLDACFWIYGIVSEIVGGKRYMECYYIDALGVCDSFRTEDNESTTLIAFINKLVALKPIFEQFTQLFLENRKQTEAKALAIEQQRKITEEKEELRKSETQKSYLKRHGFQKITYQEVIDLLGVRKLFDTYSDNDYEDEDGNEEYMLDDDNIDRYDVFYADSDVVIDDDFSMPEVAGSWWVIIVVKGNLTVRGHCSYQYYVTGNATFDWLNLSNFQKCLGEEKVLYIQEHTAEDHEVLRQSLPRKITAPYFFSWFYDLNCYEFSPETTIIALYEWDDLKNYVTSNVIFKWHQAAFVLRTDLSYFPDEPHHDANFWQTQEIYEALKKGETIYRDGFDVACMPNFNKAYAYWEDDEFQAAFILFLSVTKMSPQFYLAWYYCAEVLTQAKAFEQAIPYYERAMELATSTNHKTYDYLKASQKCSYNLIRMKKYADSLAYLDHAIDQKHQLDTSYRYRGEARLMLNKNQEALEDLQAAYENYNQHLPVLWLTGLAFHKLGKTSDSAEWLEKAREKFADAPDYSASQLLDFYSGNNVTVDWESKPIEGIQVAAKDQIFWDKQFKKTESFENIPPEFMTEEMVKWFFRPSGNHFVAYDTFSKLPERLKTREIAEIAVTSHCNPPPLDHIPAQWLDKAFCLLAFNVNLEHVPEAVIDYDVCLDAVSKDCSNLKHVPEQFRDEKMIVAAITGGALRPYTDVNLPAKYHEPSFICQAISLHFRALSNIPARYMDASAFETAWQCYRNHADWEQTLEGFSFHGEYTYDSFDKVWACFWTETFIIEAVQKGGERLYDLPPKYFTPAIVAIAGGDIGRVPKEMLTPELCLKAVSYEYASAFSAIPFEMRDEKVSAMAVKKSSENIQYVPRKHKTLAICKAAFLGDSNLLIYIPYDVHVELFSHVLKKNPNKTPVDYLYYQRGLGHLHVGAYENAIKDFKTSRDKAESETVILPESIYYEGLAHFKIGNKEKAEEFRKQALAIFKEKFSEQTIDAAYEESVLPKKQDVTQLFSSQDFGYKMQAIEKLSQGGFTSEALAEVIDAETILHESCCTDMNYWAMVWDQKRYCLYEDGQKEACYSHCIEAIDKLSKVTTWAYIAFDNNIRHALRSMHNTLAYRAFETATGLDDIKQGLALNKKSFIRAPIEDKDVCDWFYITKAELLLKASQFDPADPTYKDNLEKTRKKMTQLKLKKKGILDEEFIARHGM